MKRSLVLILSVALTGGATLALGAEYDIDPAHSSVNFGVRHLVSKTRGKFDQFKAHIVYDKDKPESWQVEASVDTASINTADAKRDKHLKSEDFFDVKKYPVMTFKSTKVEDVRGEEAKLHGDLTLHGVTKPVVFTLERGGEGTDPWGNKKIGFSARTKINRKDFGITWNKTLDAGSVLIGDEVEVVLEVEANQKPDASAASKTTKKSK